MLIEINKKNENILHYLKKIKMIKVSFDLQSIKYLEAPTSFSHDIKNGL